jgi:Arc/MetJ-type ribon-helix-helix transcriptional regulator
MSTTVQTKIPDQLLQQAQNLVEQGWVANMDELITESVRRYLESHSETMTERFVREDVDWGLHGKD